MKYSGRDQILMKYSIRTDSILETLPPFVKDFVDDCKEKNRSARTILGYVTDIRTFFRILTKENPSLKNDIMNISPDVLDKLTYKDLKEFVLDVGTYNIDGEDRINKEYAKNRKVSTIRSFYNYLYAAGDIKNNPASILKGPTINSKEPVTLSVGESAELLSCIENQNKHTSDLQAVRCEKTKYRDIAIVNLLLGTGIRVSELVCISLKDINWKTNGVRVVRKGGNEQTVYFNEDVKNALIDYIKNERISPEDEPDALFVSRKKKRMSVSAVERMVKKYAQMAVPDKRITPHRLRASYGTNLYGASHDAMLVADSLGHSNLSTVKKYVRKSDENRQRAGKMVDWLSSTSGIRNNKDTEEKQ